MKIGGDRRRTPGRKLFFRFKHKDSIPRVVAVDPRVLTQIGDLADQWAHQHHDDPTLRNAAHNLMLDAYLASEVQTPEHPEIIEDESGK